MAESLSGKEAAGAVQSLLKAAKTFVQTTAADDEVSFLQLRTQQNRELYIAPHEGYVLAVMKR